MVNAVTNDEFDKNNAKNDFRRSLTQVIIEIKGAFHLTYKTGRPLVLVYLRKYCPLSRFNST